MPGSIIAEDDRVTRFEIVDVDEIFPVGTYPVTLFGDEDPSSRQRPVITDEYGVRLDGEPWELPSGDGTEGGNFVFKFTISEG